MSVHVRVEGPARSDELADGYVDEKDKDGELATATATTTSRTFNVPCRREAALIIMLIEISTATKIGSTTLRASTLE